MQNKINVNDRVQRINDVSYTGGRMGTVVEVNEETGRARVYWNQDKDGDPLSRPVRTWVRFQDLKAL